MKKGMIPLVCMVLTLVLIIVAFIGPWWGGTEEDEFTDMEVESNMFLTKAVSKAGGAEITIDYEDLPDSDSKTVFSNTYYMVIITLVFSILAIIGILGVTFNFGPIKTMNMIGLIFCILTFILALVAALYFMVALPDATPDMDGFWMDSAGPAYGWYLMIISFILALIASIMIFMDKSVPKAAPK